MKTSSSIRSALNKSYFLLIAVFILSIGLLVGFMLSRESQENILESNMNLAQSVGNSVNLYLQETENTIKMIRDNLSGKIYSANYNSINDYLASVIENYHQIHKVRIINKNGIVRFVYPYSEAEIGINLKEAPFLKNYAGNGIYWSDSFLSMASGEPALTATLPLDEDYLVVNIDVSKFNQILSEMRNNLHIVIYDSKGTAIASTLQKHVYYRENHSNLEHVKKALAGEQVTSRFISSVQGTEMLGSSLPLNNDWVVMVSKTVNEAYNIVYEMVKLLGITGLLVLLAGYLISCSFSQKVIYPIENLTEWSQEMAAGNYSKKIKTDTFNELKVLTDSFNKMANKIKDREEKLKNQTEELYSSYQQLRAYNEEITAMNNELEKSLRKINILNERFTNMINLVSTLGQPSHLNERDFLSKLLKTAVKIVPEADYGLVCLIEEDNSCRFVDAVGHDISLLKNLRIDKEVVFNTENHGIYKQEGTAFNLERLPEKKRESFLQALKPVHESMFIDITMDSQIFGKIFLDVSKESNKGFTENTKELLNSFASLASAFFSYQRYNKLQEQFTKEFITAIIQILEIYDTYTSGHSENVAKTSARIAEEMGLSEDEVKDAYWAGMVHDIGKLLVPLSVLNKPGVLTDSEFDLIENHPYWGFMALSKSESLSHIARYVLYHHERWDGKGYPERVKGDQIPLIAQILSVADAWDAMTSKRAYRDPLPEDVALDEIIKNKGTQFSPRVVEVFIRMKKNDSLAI